MTQIGKCSQKYLAHSVSNRGQKAGKNYFFQTYLNIVMWRLRIIVYGRGLHVYMILFYYVNWFLNLFFFFFLQKSVASFLSWRISSIKYLTIGENKIDQSFPSQLLPDYPLIILYPFSMKLKISTFRFPDHHFGHLVAGRVHTVI